MTLVNAVRWEIVTFQRKVYLRLYDRNDQYTQICITKKDAADLTMCLAAACQRSKP